MNYIEILSFLVNVHGIHIGLRQIKRILKKLGCRRRGVRSNFDDIVRVMENELKGSGSIIGYRAMHQRLTVQHSLNVSRNIVRQVLKILDPEGVNARSKHRLQRRVYTAKGPNYLWHMDGYDKLKPFGFCIYGAMDGYSRRVLWLEVASTNNDPEIIGSSGRISNHLVSVGTDEINIANETCCRRPLERGCSVEFNELATMIMQDEALSMPTNWIEAKELYSALLGLIEEFDTDDDIE